MAEKNVLNRIIDASAASLPVATACVLGLGLVYACSIAAVDNAEFFDSQNIVVDSEGRVIRQVEATDINPELFAQLTQEAPQQMQPTAIIELVTATPVPPPPPEVPTPTFPPPQEPTATPLQQQGVLYCESDYLKILGKNSKIDAGVCPAKGDDSFCPETGGKLQRLPEGLSNNPNPQDRVPPPHTCWGERQR